MAAAPGYLNKSCLTDAVEVLGEDRQERGPCDNSAGLQLTVALDRLRESCDLLGLRVDVARVPRVRGHLAERDRAVSSRRAH